MSWQELPAVGGVGFVTVDFAGGGAGYHVGGFAVDDHPKVSVVADHRGGLARVDHSGVDFLPGGHEPAAGRHPPLHDDGPAGLGWQGPATASTAQPGTAV